MDYQDINVSLPHSMTSGIFREIISNQVELPKSFSLELDRQQQMSFELSVGRLSWQLDKNQVEINLVLDLSELRTFIDRVGYNETWSSPANMTETIDKGPVKKDTPTVSRKGIYFNQIRSQFLVDGKLIPHPHLTEMEYELLECLYQNAGFVCSYRKIEDKVWRGYALPSTINQKIYRLRKKLNQISPNSGERYIQTCRGRTRGYMLQN